MSSVYLWNIRNDTYAGGQTGSEVSNVYKIIGVEYVKNERKPNCCIRRRKMGEWISQSSAKQDGDPDYVW